MPMTPCGGACAEPTLHGHKKVATTNSIVLVVGHTPTVPNGLDPLVRRGEVTTLYAGSTFEALRVLSLRSIRAVIVDVGSSCPLASLQFLEAFRLRSAHHYTPVVLLNRAGSMTHADLAIAQRHRARVIRYLAELAFWLEDVTTEYPSAMAG
jgi:DNA-binding NtrC family response regulator